MGRRRRTKTQARRNHPTSRRYTPPKPPPDVFELLQALALVEQVKAAGGVAWICNDPNCPDSHR